MHLVGAYVTGWLVLSFCHAKGPTLLFNCRFGAGIEAIQTEFSALALSGSLLPALNAGGAKVQGSVFLNKGFHATGEISLSSAEIGGQFVCDNGRFENADGFTIFAQGVKVKGGVFLRSEFHATGEVSLSGAEISGQLSCVGGRFENADGHALNAQGAKVQGDVFLRNGFHATGEVSLAGVKIGGQLGCDDGRFEKEDGDALNAHGVKVQGDVFLRNGFHATGEVSLAGAEIGGQLDCDDGRFENADGTALSAEGVKVQGYVFLRNGFHATGEASLLGAEIGGPLSCENARFEKVDGDALNAQGAGIDTLLFRDVEIPSGRVDLNAAHIGSLVDDLASWPEGGRVILDGFTYDRIIGGATDSKARLDWLSRGDRWKGTFFPQPYTQLAKVLRDMGHERGARDVLFVRDEKIAAEEWKRAHRELDGTWPKARASLKADFRKFVNGLSHLLIDYGHRPLKALWGLMGLWLFATILAHWVETQGDMVPNSDVILTSDNWASVHQADHPAQAWRQTPEGQSWESFNRYAWAADVVIPILDFGQTEAWAPSTNLGTAGKTLWWGKWVLSTAGWIVLAFAAAGVAGVARRE